MSVYDRTVVSELKEDVRKRLHQECELTPGKSSSFSCTHAVGMSYSIMSFSLFFLNLGTSPLPVSHSGEVRVEAVHSESEDFSPTPSLAEVSSDDLSWLDDKDHGELEYLLNGIKSCQAVLFLNHPMLCGELSHKPHMVLLYQSFKPFMYTDVSLSELRERAFTRCARWAQTDDS